METRMGSYIHKTLRTRVRAHGKEYSGISPVAGPRIPRYQVSHLALNSGIFSDSNRMYCLHAVAWGSNSRLTFSRAALSASRLSTTLGEGSESPFGGGASVSPYYKADQFSAHHSTAIKRPISTFRPCDERLEELNMSFWTSVSISDDVAVKIISLYLETDHPLLGTFEPDLFVDDLTSCRLRHCSPLLVSAIMYWGCVSAHGAQSVGHPLVFADTL